MVGDKLKKIGLSDKEIAIFSAVYEHKKLSPPKIANLTGIKRPTVYAVAKDLVQEGFIDADTSGATTYFYAKAPDELSNIVKKEKRAITEKEFLLEEIAGELKELPTSKNFVVPKVKYVEHEENIAEFMYSRADAWKKSMDETDPTMWGFQDHTLVESKAYREWIDYFWRMCPDPINLKFLTNDSEVEREVMEGKYERRYMKYWKKSFQFTSSQWIFGDYSMMFVTNTNPHYLIETYDPLYTSNMRMIFSSIWEEI